jgi:DUF4097 and DUF4098 domain-containing protein YvlB
MRSDLPEDTFFDPRNFTVKNAKSGSTLRVWVEKDPGVLSGRGEGTLFFRVPRETSLSVETASGDIRISGLDSWELEIGSASGDVLLDDINNPFHVKTVSGDIDARRIRADSSLSTVSGDIEIVDVVGKVVAESVSGHITGTRIRLTADSLFKSISGDIRIDLDNALDSLRYDLSTVSGGLTVGSVRAARGLQMGNGDLTLRGDTVSGSQSYR